MSTSDCKLISILESIGSTSENISIRTHIPSIEEHIPSLLGMFLMSEYMQYRDAIFSIIPNLSKTHLPYFIPPLLQCLNNPNSVDFKTTLDVLQQIDRDLLFPAIYSTLEYCWSDELWIQGISILMSRFKKSELKPYHKQIMNTFRRGNRSNCLDDSALALIGMIASPEMDTIVPNMLERLAHVRPIEFKLELIDALLKFDRSVLESHRSAIKSIYEQSNDAEKIALQPLM